MDITGKEEVVMDEETGTLENCLQGGVGPFDFSTIARDCTKVFKQILEGMMARETETYGWSFRLVARHVS